MVKKELSDIDEIELRARRLVEQLALVLQGSLLVQHSPTAVADAFCATRLSRDWGGAFGTMPKGLDLDPDHRARLPRPLICADPSSIEDGSAQISGGGGVG